MSGNLPEWVQRSPRYFYAAAVFLFFAYFAIGVYEIQNLTMTYGQNEAVQLAMLRVLLDALREAIYAVGTGVLIHVALAIWAAKKSNYASEAAE